MWAWTKSKPPVSAPRGKEMSTRQSRHLSSADSDQLTKSPITNMNVAVAAGRVHPLNMERSDRSALHPHRDPPQTEENVRDACGRLPANREPEDQETCMPQQRQTQGNRHSAGPHTRTAATSRLNNPRP